MMEADKISKALVRERLAACVSLLPLTRSHFRWEGKMHSCRETLLLIKTASQRFLALEKRIRQLHSYDVPEILAIPVPLGSRPYLRWLRESIRRPRRRSKT